MKAMRVMYCQQPDRDVPKLTCGYPLPCPWHTAIIEEDKVTLPRKSLSGYTIAALYKIRDALRRSR